MSTTVMGQDRSAGRSCPDRVPRPAPDLDLIGRYEGSGLKNPPYLVRRADGQVAQLTELLFAVASLIDGRRSFDDIAAELAERHERDLTGDDVRFLVENKLQPAGLVASDADDEPPARSVPLLALRFRSRVLPPRVVGALTSLFRPLFHAPVVAAVVAAFIGLDVWLFAIHGAAQPIRAILYQPGFVVLGFALVVASTFLHECGHATACRYGGANPGAIGAGIYLIWPAFFTDVTDSYRLGRKGRIRTDLGGVYFNALFSLGTAAAYFITHAEALLVVVIMQHLQMLYQFLPFLRLDGYYLVADITGVPDLFNRMGPILKSLVPWRHERRASDLKPWVRAVVTVWVVTTCGFLIAMFGSFILAMPRVIATAGDSFALRYDALTTAFRSGGAAEVVVAFLQLASLVLPMAGGVLLTTRIVARLGRAVRDRAQPMGPRMVLVGAAAATVAVVAMSWGASVSFEPIGPGESWALDSPTPTTSHSTVDGTQPGSVSYERSATKPSMTSDANGVTGSHSASAPTDPTGGSTQVAGRVAGSTMSRPAPTPTEDSASPSPTPTSSPSPTPSESPQSTPSPEPSSSPSP